MIQPCSPAATFKEHPGVRLVIEEDDRKIKLLLLQVSSAFRGQGLAKKVLSELCAYADAKGLPVGLWAADPLTWEQHELVSFYKQFGFRVAGSKTWDDCVPMTRRPTGSRQSKR